MTQRRTRLTLTLLVAAFLPASAALAQELLVNNGFEAYTRCPTGPGVIDGWVDDWHRTSVASTDYQNTCGFSAHAPRTGNAHVGLLAYDFSANYREYATGVLTSPLVAGRTYRFELWCILDPGRLHAVTELGAWFSDTLPSFPGTGPPAGVTPQVVNSGATLADKDNWMLVTGTFVAVGGESYVTIGNFLDDATTTTSGWPCCGQFGAYYHVDDVSVTEVRNAAVAVTCAIGGDHCALNPALDGDGQLDFGETVDLAVTISNVGRSDLTSYTALVTATGATVVSPPGGSVAVGSIPVDASSVVTVTLQLPPAGNASCGDPVDVVLQAQSSDQGTFADDDLTACSFRLGDPDGTCSECVTPPPCLWRADATQLSPLMPPASALFMPPTGDGLSLQGAPWQCPIADGDLERDAAALTNGVPLSFYQANLATDTLRLAKVPPTIRFRY